MISTDWCRVVAAYNPEMNRRPYDAADHVPDAERRVESGAFWGSLHGTLCHLPWADRMWMHCFAGWQKPTAIGKVRPELVEDWGIFALPVPRPTPPSRRGPRV